MRLPLLVLAGLMILGGDVLIACIVRTIPGTVFAGRPGWAVLAALMIVSGVALVLWANLRRAG
jgi:hypothetical protein